MKTKFFTIAAAVVLALGLSATESKAQSSALSSSGVVNKSSNLSVFEYPNPATDIINVVTNIPSPMTGQAKIKIVNSSGQELISEMCSDCAGKSARTYDVSGYAPGIYFVVLEYKEMVKSVKFLKK
jgi:hypothetical protein